MEKPTCPSQGIISLKMERMVQRMVQPASSLMPTGYVGVLFRSSDGATFHNAGAAINGSEFLTRADGTIDKTFSCREYGQGKALQTLRTRRASVSDPHPPEGESGSQGAIILSLPEGDYILYASGYPGGYMDAIIAAHGICGFFEELAEAQKAYAAYDAAQNQE